MVTQQGIGTRNEDTQEEKQSLRQYLQASVGELKKLSHPTRAETIQTTVMAVSMIVIGSICLFLLDLLFGQIMRAIVG